MSRIPCFGGPLDGAEAEEASGLLAYIDAQGRVIPQDDQGAPPPGGHLHKRVEFGWLYVGHKIRTCRNCGAYGRHGTCALCGMQ